MTDEIKKLRDKRLRRRILRALRGAQVGPLGGYGGRALRDHLDDVSPSSDRTEDDEHVIGLCRDLVKAGLVTENDERRRRDDRFGLPFLFYVITTEGSALIEELIAPHPLVDDERR